MGNPTPRMVMWGVLRLWLALSSNLGSDRLYVDTYDVGGLHIASVEVRSN